MTGKWRYRLTHTLAGAQTTTHNAIYYNHIRGLMMIRDDTTTFSACAVSGQPLTRG